MTIKNQTSAATADAPVTVAEPAAAKGVNKRTAPMTTRHLKDAKAPAAKAPAAKGKPRGTAKAPTTAKQRAAGITTTAEIAAEQGISAKTLRARIRRNIDAWAPLFKDGEKHVFADNKTTRNKIAALLS